MNTHGNTSKTNSELTYKKILITWLPLAASWALMSLELPIINAIVARLENPEINLAAYGGIVYPIALTIEAPIIMLLAASTALSRDWKSYCRLRKITLWMAGLLGLLHLIIAVTPLFDFIAGVILGVPTELIDPARTAFLVMTPWTPAIAFRRFQQGAMIRFGHSRAVGETTFIRLMTVAVVLIIGITTKFFPGAILAGLAQGLGVTSEAVFAGFRIRKLFPDIKKAPKTEQVLTIKRFIKFYIPLALTSSLWLLWQPFISASVSRMPDPIESLAIWSVVTGLLFLIRSPGVAYNEAVVALLEEPGSYPILRKFSWIASLLTTAISAIFILTPLSALWFTFGANLNPGHVNIARTTLILGLPLGVLSVYISLFQGTIVNKERTEPVAEAVVLFLLTLSAILLTGVVTEITKGVYVASAAFSTAHLMQALWLYFRSRKQRQNLAQS